ncbi:hypothetical protein KKE60_05895 [Patescibacteria group bacterium]|nr:hypothetical protein [Patescibacteria group bacterium]
MRSEEKERGLSMDPEEQGRVRRCPECGGAVVRAGVVRINRSGDEKQQWKCAACGRRTLNPKEGDDDVSAFLSQLLEL